MRSKESQIEMALQKADYAEMMERLRTVSASGRHGSLDLDTGWSEDHVVSQVTVRTDSIVINEDGSKSISVTTVQVDRNAGEDNDNSQYAYTYCKEAGLPESEYAFVTNFVSLTIRFKNPLAPYLTDQGNSSSNERLNERLNPSLLETLALIKANPGIQRKESVAKTGKGDATIGRHLVTLAEKDFIEHKGSKRTGGYYAK